MKQILNDELIRQTVGLMKEPKQLFEIRIIPKKGSGKQPKSGYFKDVEVMLKELHKLEAMPYYHKTRNELIDTNIHILLNSIHESCFSKSQSNEIKIAPTSTQSGDIIKRDWFMIDIDPNRTSDTGSSQEEQEEAYQLSQRIKNFLRDMGFYEPIYAMSGNGYHLLYRISLGTSDEATNLIKTCYKAMNSLFGTDKVHFDESVADLPRPCKLYGTLSQKGADTEERPHRMSRIIGNPCREDIKVNDIDLLRKLAAVYPSEQEQTQNTWKGYGDSEKFDLENWLDKYGIEVKSKHSYNSGTRYILKHCPMNLGHEENGTETAIFKNSNGSIGFSCRHSRCQGYRWQDVRVKFEPNAYEKRQQEYQEKHTAKPNKTRIIPPLTDTPEAPLFYTAKAILSMPKVTEEYIPSGIKIIDEKLGGLKKTYVTLLSGVRGGSKSTLLGQIMLNSINNDYNVICFCGELTANNYLNWLMLQAAGRGYTKQIRDNKYIVSEQTQNQIAEWLGDRLQIFNNDKGNNAKAILDSIETYIDKCKADLVVIDNLMIMDFLGLSEDGSNDKYENQKLFVHRLHSMAQKKNVHVLLVAHPRKTVGFLRLNDVSGTADITNLCENALIIHRNNMDFQKAIKSDLMWKETDPRWLAIKDGTNIVEIAKDRDNGTTDVFIPLWYEVETKRLKNDRAENIVYGWRDREPIDDFSNISDMVGEAEAKEIQEHFQTDEDFLNSIPD